MGGRGLATAGALILIALVFFMPGGIVAGVRLLKAKVVRVVPRLPDVRVLEGLQQRSLPAILKEQPSVGG
jgi:hypothetical protein